MAQKTNEKVPAAESAVVSQGGWDRFVDDAHKRPKYYVTLLVAAVAVIAAVVLGLKYFESSKQEKAAERVNGLKQALALETPEERIRGLLEIRSEFTDPESGPAYLLTLARTYREAADEASDNTAKIANFKKAVESVDKLASDYKGHPLVVMPWQVSPSADGTPNPTIGARIKQYCESQIAFLETHPISPKPSKDNGFTATITLKDPDGNTKNLKVAFYSSVAPFAASTFKRVAESGYYTGTKINALEQGFSMTGGPAPIEAAIFGSAYAKVAPEATDKWFGPDDNVGFTLPRERNELQFKKGRVALEWLDTAFGTSPVRVVIFTNDVDPIFAFKARAVFGEVTEGLEILDELANAKRSDEALPGARNTFALNDSWTIDGITFSGEPEHKPGKVIDDPIKLPEIKPDTDK